MAYSAGVDMEINVTVTKNDIVDSLVKEPYGEVSKIIMEYDRRMADVSITESLIIGLVRSLIPDQEFTKKRLPFIDWSKVREVGARNGR